MVKIVTVEGVWIKIWRNSEEFEWISRDSSGENKFFGSLFYVLIRIMNDYQELKW